MIISIALATYNGEAYLQEQLNSFVNQTRLPDELIVTDDCSTDKTFEILQAFAKSAPFEVRIFRNRERLGYGRNFNEALIRTTGDLVFLSDQDDVWFPQKIATVADIARQDERALVVMNDALITNTQLKDKGLTSLGQLRSAGLTESRFVIGCCTAIKRELLDVCLPVPLEWPSHDSWIAGISLGIQRKKVVDIVLQYYRRHENNTSNDLVNRNEPVNRLYYYQKWYGCQLKTSHQKQSNFYVSPHDRLESYMAEWIEKRINDIPLSLRNDFEGYLIHLTNLNQKRHFRRIIQSMPLLERGEKAFQFYKSGGYRYFSGWESLLRDIVFGNRL